MSAQVIPTENHGESIYVDGIRRNGGTYLGLSLANGNTPYVKLDASAARNLGAWLVKRYGLQGWVPAKGDTVRILPGAEDCDGDEVVTGGATRAEVTADVDSDGEVRVRFLDGTDPYDVAYVLPKFLAHPDAILPEDAKPETTKPVAAPTPRLAIGTPAVIVTDDARANTGTLAGLPKGTPVIINGDMPSGSYRVTAHTGGALKARYVRATDVALTMPAAAAKPTTPAALKVGDVVALKPGAKTCYGGGVYFKSDVTRVKVESSPDGDGDYYVRNVDGSGTNYSRGDSDTQYVGRDYLGDPITDAARPWAVGDEAIVTSDHPTAAQFYIGDRVRVTALPTARDDRYRAEFVSGRGHRHDHGGWFIPASAIRRP